MQRRRLLISLRATKASLETPTSTKIPFNTLKSTYPRVVPLRTHEHQRARFAEEVLSFMDSVDGTVSRRAVMASGSMMPAGRL